MLIVGDYTTRIGDPSGRSTERPILSEDEIDRNAETYLEQALQILVPEQTEVRRNSEWLAGLSFADVIQLTRMMTVAQMLERDDFAGRYSSGQPISVSELLYPLMQAYDSVAVEADVELGGTDQLYNLLAGREVMQAYGLEPQVVLTTPLLVSWDGEKMSSSVGNNIPLIASPEEQFGRTMRISDDLLEEWYRLVVEDAVPGGAPLEAKLALARWIVTRSHGDEAARAAEEHFTRVVREGRAPDDVPEHCLPAGDPIHLPAVLAEAFGLSTSEARRLIAQGAVKLDDEPVSELDRPALGARRRRRAGGQAPVRPSDGLRSGPRTAWLTQESPVLPSLGLPRGGCRKPVTRRRRQPSSEQIRLLLFRPRGPLVRVRGFLLPQSRRGL